MARWPTHSFMEERESAGSTMLYTPQINLDESSSVPSSAFKLISALLDFDNSDEAWRRYDKMTAREL